jgi:methyl-accepting chemotaxis protein
MALLPAVLEKSRVNDIQGAIVHANAMAESRERLTKIFDEHFALNARNSADSAQQAKAIASRGFLLNICALIGAFVLVGAINLMTLNAIKRSLSAVQQAVKKIEGDHDFTTRAEVIGNDEIAEVSEELNRLLDKLQGNLKTIADGSHAVASSAGQLSGTSGEVARASQEQSEAASGMAATVEQLTVSINHVGDRAQDADQISRDSENLAVKGESVISQTVQDIQGVAVTVSEAAERIHGLEQHSQAISNVIAVIKDVADQTNLLALNAAIEAARAGEQGRGFAVVADEVRKLAERTAVSTTEISETISRMRSSASEAVATMEGAVGKVSKGVESAQLANEAIRAMGEGSRKNRERVDEITEAIREQAVAMNEIAVQVERIAQMSEECSAAAGSSADTSRELDRVAKELRQIVATYRL